MDKAVPRLQEQYGVRISIDAIIVAAGGVRRFAPEMLPGEFSYFCGDFNCLGISPFKLG